MSRQRHHSPDSLFRAGLASWVAPRGKEFLYSDGVTAGARCTWPLSTPGDGIGNPGQAWTVAQLVYIPKVIRNNYSFWTISDSASGTTSSNCMQALINSGDFLRVSIGDSAATNRRFLQSVQLISPVWGGRWVMTHVVSDGVNAPSVYFDGQILVMTESTTGTPPAWNAGFQDDYLTMGVINGGSMYLGRAEPPRIINGMLSAAEVLEHAQTGLLPDWCDLTTGSMVAAHTSDFSAGVDNWAQNIGDANLVLTGNVDAVSGVNDTLQITASGAGKGLHIKRPTTILAGWAYRMEFDYYADVGCGVPFIGPTYAGTANGIRGGSPLAVVEGSWQAGKSLDFVNVATSTVTQLLFTGYTTTGMTVVATLASGKNIYLKNVKLRPLGPLFKPVIQPISIVDDMGDNRIMGIMLAGMKAVTGRRDWVIRAQTNTNGNQQILGAAVFPDATKVVLGNWWINNGGTSKTVSLGNASAGTQYQNAGTFAAGRVEATLATKVPATANLWVNSNGTDLLQHTIRGHMVD